MRIEPLEAVTPVRLADAAAMSLRRYIEHNQLKAGDRLPSERQLAAMLSTSRATVSQALRTLSITGLVDVRHGSGAYVQSDPKSATGVSFTLVEAPGSAADAQLAELIHWLERALTIDGAEPRFDHDVIRTAYQHLESSRGTTAAFIEADAQFHRAVIAGGQNRYLVALFEEGHRRIHQATYSGWVRADERPDWLEGPRFDRQLDLHRRIMDAAISGDIATLAIALEDHHRAVVSHLDPAHSGPG